MSRYLVRHVGIAGVLLAAMTWAGTSQAHSDGRASPSEEAREDRPGPNRALLGAGLAVLGLSYTPAVVVGAQSPLLADQKLYIPVAGPWLDLAQRPSCTGVPTDAAMPCNREPETRALIALDGAFQGLGALLVAGGLLMREHHQVTGTTATDDAPRGIARPEIHFSPAHLGDGGYGMTAYGTF